MHPGPFVETMRIVHVFITLKQKGTEMLLNSDIDMADVKPLEQKNHAVSLDTTKHTVSTGFPHVPFFSDS